MSVEQVKQHLARFGLADRVMEFSESSATVEQAAHAVGVEPARIAKTLAFCVGERVVVVVAAGDARIHNPKFKKEFGGKGKMPSYDDCERLTGHAPGGVCPFALADGVEVCLDESLRRFDTVYPAAGSAASAVKLTCVELEHAAAPCRWVDVCKDWKDE